MKRIPLTAIIILSVFFLFSAGCSKNSGTRVKANKKVVALVNTWGKDVGFYTSKENPLKTIEGLKQNEIACFGPELAPKIQAFYGAAETNRTYGNAVQVIAPGQLQFQAEGSPRLFLTWTGNAPKIKNAVKVTFYE